MGGHGEHGHHHHHTVHNPVLNHYIDQPHHETAKFVCPDYKIYKVENAPELLKIQQKLAEKGLKDHWLRYIFYY
jgi:hypothetical protein